MSEFKPVMGRQQVIDALCKTLGIETVVNDKLLARDFTLSLEPNSYPIVTVRYMVIPITDAAAHELKEQKFSLVLPEQVDE